MFDKNLSDNIFYNVKSIDMSGFFSCPKDYQSYVIRIMSIQAYAELCGANEIGYQLRLAPNYRSRKGLSRIVYDEATHAYLLYQILEKIGVSEAEAVSIAEGGKLSSNKKTESLSGVISVGDDENEWIDLILNNMLMDRAGGYMVNNFSQSSFSPWAEACEKIYSDEEWHKDFGLREFEKYIKNNDISVVGKKFSSWFLKAINFFGPPPGKSQEILKKYGIKRRSNDELRSDFIIDLTSVMDGLGLGNLVQKNISQQYPYFYLAE